MEDFDDEPAVVHLSDDEEHAVAPVEDSENPDVIQLDDDVIPEEDVPDDEETAENLENLENVLDDSEIIAENSGEADQEVEEEDNPFADDDDSDEDGGGVQVTIRKMEPTEKPAARQGKLDLDTTATINDKPIYDLDLAQMEDRPWRKPGADITDYFNYGFTEETWNLYCERQKKLRIEFAGNQKAANEALFSSIKIANPLANPVMNTTSSVVKVLTDNGGRFKQHVHQSAAPTPLMNDQVIRTVISGNNQSAPSLMDFTRPPPGMSMPPPMGTAPPTSVADPIFSDAPPGVDMSSDLPPGVESAPGASVAPLLPGGLDLNLGLPPLGFNPNMPPPGMPPMGMMSTSLPPPGFAMPPPQFQQHSRAGFGPGPVGAASAPRSLMGSGAFSTVSDDDEERRSSRRKRSRSRSPHRDRDRDRRDRETRRRGERESDRTSSRRHRSRSASGDRRRKRDDREREKRRERRGDDEDRKKRSRRGDEEEESSSGRKERKEKSSRSRHEDEESSTGVVVKEEIPDDE
ncbi:Pre-mRNA polyadenylation factor Fip1 domain-containing protein [Caenorhabditis elegans]|uniref:Pre-mRNA polyadenylation factor Fip1 domain-containing protein n=1 Tax=Caenorhabditis elegans TaxID=6239 RepID=A0A164D3G3_CAEEL|nr:Pre-mRNA 3'-end-processing factor FIP1 [Caenorhabditis elegans]SAP35571.1 Pre-mRNA 3'-end-processing factor FIP1 [Caenorhabditis elegans]|eukprot:NP_001317811.1 Factor Interacting with Poly(A) Polymerase [Caenorhabditis elegans]